jgi:thiol-disulfide isomerase/thioredoxin
MLKNLVTVSTILMIVCLCVPMSALAQQDDVSAPSIGGKASPLTDLQWVKGGPVQMKKGSVYVVEFWATWCGPCRTSIPHLTQLQKKLADRHVTVIGVSTETLDKVKPFVENMGDKMDYAIAIDPKKTVNNAYMQAFNVRGIPHAFIVDKQGKLAWHGHPMDGMDQVLEEVLKGSFDAKAHAEKQAIQEKQQKQLQVDFDNYFKLANDEDSVDQAREVGDRLVTYDHSGMLNALAWNILTKVAVEKRDLDLALAAAAKCVKLTKEKDPSVLDTYARALYETAKQNIEKAVTYQKKAVELSGDNERMQTGLKKALERYEAAKVE